MQRFSRVGDHYGLSHSLTKKLWRMFPAEYQKLQGEKYNEK